ncbi:hypothetical protein G7046_g107 [Stylonectria norvegica]|nr:hypothetical protein G7046_g107 [Stylonectria norvegica]
MQWNHQADSWLAQSRSSVEFPVRLCTTLLAYEPTNIRNGCGSGRSVESSVTMACSRPRRRPGEFPRFKKRAEDRGTIVQNDTTAVGPGRPLGDSAVPRRLMLGVGQRENAGEMKSSFPSTFHPSPQSPQSPQSLNLQYLTSVSPSAKPRPRSCIHSLDQVYKTLDAVHHRPFSAANSWIKVPGNGRPRDPPQPVSTPAAARPSGSSLAPAFLPPRDDDIMDNGDPDPRAVKFAAVGKSPKGGMRVNRSAASF